MKRNNALAADSYKLSHFLQTPPNTQHMSAYIEPRGVDKDFPLTNEIVTLGQGAFLDEYMNDAWTKGDVDEAEHIAKLHGEPFNREGFDLILNEYGGFRPVHIQAIPEGTVVPPGTPQVQITNSEPIKCAWLTGYLETQALRAIWYPTTVATLSREIKKVFKEYLLTTADSLDGIDFMLHDFGARGVSSGESAALGGMAHLVNFKGSDTLEAVKFIRDVYSKDHNYMPAFSVPAAEHSTISAWLHFGGEEAAYYNMIDKFSRPGSIYAVVSDTYNIYNAVDNIWGVTLKDDVINRGGRLVVRPDSGVPEEVVLRVVEILGDRFGYTLNSKGYKVLHPSVRVIQGDGVDYWSIKRILDALVKNGWSVENVVFGMGGALLQKVNRDSLKYAMKASQITVEGKNYDIFKNPVTDKGKKSKSGRFAVSSDFKVMQEDEMLSKDNILQTVYSIQKGSWPVVVKDDFETIRARARV